MTDVLKSPRVTGALVALLGVAAATVLLVTLTSGASDAASSPKRREFGILADPSSAARAALSPGAQELLAERRDSNGLRPVAEPLSSVGTTETSAGEVTVARFGQELCISVATEYQAETCGSLTSAEEGRMFLLFPGCQTSVVVGVLPDSASGVSTVATTAARPTQITANANVYVAEIPSTDSTISGKTALGSFSFSLPLDRVAESPVCG